MAETSERNVVTSSNKPDGSFNIGKLSAFSIAVAERPKNACSVPIAREDGRLIFSWGDDSFGR